jgi:hypothetical protein
MKLAGPWINRKDIARWCKVSVRQVRLNEVRWGIKPFRKDLNRRVVLYSRGPTLLALTNYGILASREPLVPVP